MHEYDELKKELEKISKKKNKMWTIIKFDKKKLYFLKKDLQIKLGNNFKIYIPKLFLHKYKKNKLIEKEYNLLGDYLFCYHDDFSNNENIKKLQYSRGLKYFLNGFVKSQNEIIKFISNVRTQKIILDIYQKTFINFMLTQNIDLRQDHLQK